MQMLVKERVKLQPKTKTLHENELPASPPSPIDYEKLAQLPIGDQFRARKKQISIRMDVDLLAWFQAQPGKYQQLVNKACRVYMQLCQRDPEKMT
jgi:uncharacterized protein (DUF4415 family)